MSDMPPGQAPISVFILTYNEERNIRTLLDSIKGWADEIVIVDSFGTDATLDICRSYGCTIVQNKFINHAIQCNWVLDTFKFKHEWILRLDSDEVVPPLLKAELAEIARTAPADLTGIYMDRRIYFMNRWLKHGGIYPHRVLRMFRRNAGRFEIKTEEHFVPSHGRTMNAKHDFLENNRNNTLKFWLAKHDQLADTEVSDMQAPPAPSGDELPPRLFGTRPERMRWLKTHVYRRCPLLLRPFLYFFYRYFIRLGFLDGRPGLIFHVLQAFFYYFYIDARIYEQRTRWFDKDIDLTRL